MVQGNIMSNKLNENLLRKNISLLNAQSCTGCGACFQICPQSCISMKENEEGFFSPSVDKDCINCGLCVSHCPIFTPIKNDEIKLERYAVILKDKELLPKSSSGGLFAGIANYILKNNGVVYGAAYDKNLDVHHIGITNVKDLAALQGSKYVTSNTETTFADVKNKLEDGIMVLYSGSPCQIAGVKAFLGRSYANFYTMDLICHGVPSLKLFRKYLQWLGKKHHGKIIYYGFRDKDVAGWCCRGKILVKTKTKTKTKTIIWECDPYYNSFMKCETYRESCYNCLYANTSKRSGDISIGDFWGTDMNYPEIPRENGISFCSINSYQGQKIWGLVRDFFDIYECHSNESLKLNIAYNHPSERPVVRNSIYDGIDGNISKFFSHFHYSNYYKFAVSMSIPRPVKKIVKKVLGKT